MQLSFLIYVVTAIAAALVYRGLRTHAHLARPRRGLHKSRNIVLRLSALFTLDSAGGGFAVTSLLVLYLDVRFGLSPAAPARRSRPPDVLTAFSQFLSARLAGRIGLVRTMVFTHLPANVFLILAGIVPNARRWRSPSCCCAPRCRRWTCRSRQALVMRVVEPDERAAAASVTNVPRSLGARDHAGAGRPDAARTRRSVGR